MIIGEINPRSTVRLVCANNRSYHLTVIDPSGDTERKVDVEKIFDGFRFTTPPQPMFKSNQNDAAALGQKAGEAIAILAVVAVLLTVGVVIWRKRKKVS